MQDVDGQLRDFQDKQNIDIGLIMGRSNNSVSTVSERMPVFPRASIMRMGTARSLSVSECLLCIVALLWLACGLCPVQADHSIIEHLCLTIEAHWRCCIIQDSGYCTVSQLHKSFGVLSVTLL